MLRNCTYFNNLNSGQLLGNLIAILSGICYAGIFITNGSEYATPKQASLFGYLFGRHYLSIICIYRSCGTGDMTINSVYGSGIIWFCFFYLQGSELTSPLIVLLICSVEPVLNTLWVLIAIGECPGFWEIIGIIIVISGVISYQVLLNFKGVGKEIDYRNTYSLSYK